MKVLTNHETHRITGGTNTEALFYYTMQAVGNLGTIVEALSGVLSVTGDKSNRKFNNKGVPAVAP